MRITELHKITPHKTGHISLNNERLEPHEKSTVQQLASYGFNIEIIKPNNTPHSDNPDLCMLGTIWEMKAPTSSNLKTLKKRFHKASLQADHIIFDLRGINKIADRDKVEKYIIQHFSSSHKLRRLILLKDNQKALDIIK